MRDNIIDYNVMHIMTRRIMNSIVFNKHQFLFVFKNFHNFSCFSQIPIPLIILDAGFFRQCS